MSGVMTLPGWSQLFLLLGAEVAAVVVLAALVAHQLGSAWWRRVVWQVSTFSLLLLLAGELTGVLRGFTDWSVAVWRQPRAETEGTGVLLPEDTLERRSIVNQAYESDGVDLLNPPARLQEVQTATGAEVSGHVLGTIGVPASATRARSRDEAVWAVALWAIAASLLAARSCLGRLLLVVMRSRHRLIADQPLQSRVDRVARRLGLRRRVHVVLARRLSGPIAFGTLRPTIALPAGFASDFSAIEQEAMLAHELAHLAAYDPAWHTLADLAAAALWWHPLAWWSRWQLRASSELAADEASQLVQDGPSALASCLVQLAGRVSQPRPAVALRIEGNGFRSSLGRRVERLLSLPSCGWQPPRRVARHAVRTVGPMVLVAIALLCSAWSQPSPFTEGGSLMHSIEQAWRHSVAAVTLTGMLGLGTAVPAAPAVAETASADAIAQDEETKVHVEFDDDRVVKESKGSDSIEEFAIELRFEDDEADRAELLLQLARELKEQAQRLQEKRAAKENELKRKKEFKVERLIKKGEDDAALQKERAEKKDPGQDQKRWKFELKSSSELDAAPGKIKKLQTKIDAMPDKIKKLSAVDQLIENKELLAKEQVEKAKKEGDDKAVMRLLKESKQAEGAELGVVLKELRAEVSQLRREVEELRQIVHKRGGAGSGDKGE